MSENWLQTCKHLENNRNIWVPRRGILENPNEKFPIHAILEETADVPLIFFPRKKWS